ncbi:hypothetical protein [Winogradskyella tangerina]|uniref:hypothetical protein n=1 Tax=Winogradskyella tangerina TaxID=2023240 RepID=UPI000DBE0F70|nr:hypothetical protein [Winogradskyella tangerina]
MKNLKNLGKTLSKVEQKNVLGGDTLKRYPGEGFECIEGMCDNMPNPNYNPLETAHNPGNPVFVKGVCRDGECFYE